MAHFINKVIQINHELTNYLHKFDEPHLDLINIKGLNRLCLCYVNTVGKFDPNPILF